MTHKRFIIQNARTSYANVWKPVQKTKTNTEMVYKVALLIPKTDVEQLKRIKAAIKSAIVEKFGADFVPPPNFKMPIHDGDALTAGGEKKDAAYAGHYSLNPWARETDKPGIVDATGQPIIDPEQFYSGCYCHASVNFFAYKNESTGVGVALNNLMKTKEGERLDGRKSATDDFAAFVVEKEPGDDTGLPF